MKILFLHTRWDGLTSEYRVHTILARFADPSTLQYHFIWQISKNSNEILNYIEDPDRYSFFDFGRDYSFSQKPSRVKRFILMMKRFPFGLKYISEQAKHNKPDFIYSSQQDLDVMYGRLISKHLKIPHVIHLHYNVGPWLGLNTLEFIKDTRRLIAVSEFVRENAILNGIDPLHIRTVLNPIATTFVQQNSNYPISLRAEMGWPEDTPIIVAVGRLDIGKGHVDLLRAFANVIKVSPKARLLICGTSTMNYETFLFKKTEELNLKPYVVFTGQRNDITRILNEFNIFCLPTQLEPCALVFLEAMMAKLPIVAYYSGGVPEQVINNETALLSYPEDISRLSQNLITLVTNPELARNLGEAGKRRAVNEFSPNIVSKRWLSVLESFL